MHKLVFLGPTLPFYELVDQSLVSEIHKLESVEELNKYKNIEDAIFILPPISGGDLYKLKDYTSPFLVAIIDGYFENRLSIWHKEILFFLNKGVAVFGSSSMGALRAAELSYYGMKGIGKIYDQFCNDVYEDDDEVTVSHGPAEMGYPQISEAMVNIRETLRYALENKILTPDQHDILIQTAKNTFYKRRNYGLIIQEAIKKQSHSEKNFARFHLWLQKNRVDQKKADALKLIQIVDRYYQHAPSVLLPDFNFEDTVIWRNSITG